LKYTVIWLPGAEQELLRLWLDEPERSKVTAAANELERILSRSPREFSESREGERRITFAEPLAATFFISEDDRKVIVVEVWRY
jgi:hypothetical protein